jgi:hypothetical protein
MDEWFLCGENLVGIGTDGANVMCGSHHSVVSLLQRTWPNVIHIKCVCYSVDLIAKSAVRQALPTHIEYMICESYNWFAHSAVHLSAYQDVAKLVGFSNSFSEEDESPEEQENLPDKNPLWLISPSDTRWLVLADCVERILGQYDALKAHFQIAYNKEKCFQAKTLFLLYEDKKNYLFLLFLHPILQELKRLSKLFQSNTADNLRIFLELEASFRSFATRILKPTILNSNSSEDLSALNIDTEFCLLETDSVDLGSLFLQQLDKSSLTRDQFYETLFWQKISDKFLS